LYQNFDLFDSVYTLKPTRLSENGFPWASEGSGGFDRLKISQEHVFVSEATLRIMTVGSVLLEQS